MYTAVLMTAILTQFSGVDCITKKENMKWHRKLGTLKNYGQCFASTDEKTNLFGSPYESITNMSMQK